MNYSYLPALNALLNGTSAVLLTMAFIFIRRRNIAAHKRCMLAAVICSVLFLTSYLVYHAHIGIAHRQGLSDTLDQIWRGLGNAA